MTNLVALIPLRGGSKSIPKKNIRPMGGKPLCWWVLNAAHSSNLFSKIIVSTDSEEIATTVLSFGFGTTIEMRPAELATDTATTESVMLHILSKYQFDILCTIQATSPLTNSQDLIQAYNQFIFLGADSLVTGVRTKRFFWSNNGQPINYDPLNRPRRQDFDGYIMENGSFYYTKREILNQYACRLGGKISVFEMAEEHAIEIDEPSDWVQLENLIWKGNSKSNTPLNIKLLVLDVDGTLTDAGMYYSENGELLKKFNTRDAKGLELIRQRGIEIAIITAEESPIVVARAKKLKINHCYIGVKDKVTKLKSLIQDLGFSLDQVAYIGDDINDLDCLKMVGFSSCPSDAVTAIKNVSQYVCKLKGGEGAVREVCDMLILKIC